MPARLIWRTVKVALILVILGWVGYRFFELLSGLRRETVAWDLTQLPIAGFWYLVGLVPSALVWWWAMHRTHQRPGFVQAFRAHLIGHLGKYIPGKAMVVVMRTAMVRGPRVRLAVAAFAVVYEALTGIASAGILSSAVMLVDRQLAASIMEGVSVAVGFMADREWLIHLVLLAAVVLTLPWCFNPVARWLVAPFRRAESAPLPPFDSVTLHGGLVLGGVSWVFMGLSLLATIDAVYDVAWGVDHLVRCTVYISIATAVAFWTPMPGGLGVREVVLLALLLGVFPADLPLETRAGLAALVALLLRCTWMATELLLAALLYPLPLWTALHEHPPTS